MGELGKVVLDNLIVNLPADKPDEKNAEAEKEWAVTAYEDEIKKRDEKDPRPVTSFTQDIFAEWQLQPLLQPEATFEESLESQQKNVAAYEPMKIIQLLYDFCQGQFLPDPPYLLALAKRYQKMRG